MRAAHFRTTAPAARLETRGRPAAVVAWFSARAGSGAHGGGNALTATDNKRQEATRADKKVCRKCLTRFGGGDGSGQSECRDPEGEEREETVKWFWRPGQKLFPKISGGPRSPLRVSQLCPSQISGFCFAGKEYQVRNSLKDSHAPGRLGVREIHGNCGWRGERFHEPPTGRGPG